MTSRFISFFISGTRLFLGIVMFTAGMSKLYHGAFPGLIGPVWLTDELEKYGLEYLGQFIAWSQAVIGLLLMTQRFATLGAVMLLPMLLNIFMVLFSLGLHYYKPGQVNSAINTSIINAFLIMLNVILLLFDFRKLKFIFDEGSEFLKTRTVRRTNRNADLIVVAGMLICLFSPALQTVSRTASYLIVAIGITVCVMPVFMKRRSTSGRIS